MRMRYSIITINYNNSEGLKRTIKSVISQTSKDFEYIIIDGGSTDGSVDIIKQYATHIRYWISEKDKGVYNAMNKGVAQAHGDYCIFMNSGDCFHSSDVLDIGKHADIIMLDISKYDDDIIPNIVKNGSVNDVKLTMINGKVLYENGKYFFKESVEEINKKAQDVKNRIEAEMKK